MPQHNGVTRTLLPRAQTSSLQPPDGNERLGRWACVSLASVIVFALVIVLIGGNLVGIADSPENASASAITSPRPKPTNAEKPKRATRERTAKNVPERPLGKHPGPRFVYHKALTTVWTINEADEVVYRFPLVGRWDRPVKGKYEIFSQSRSSGNPNSKVTFDYVTRFA